jgi:hypothetical protein
MDILMFDLTKCIYKCPKFDRPRVGNIAVSGGKAAQT